ncbi:heavy metal translocating P-type ATPase [Thiosulfativibrio zosterae]|uniref:Copper-translocating P-type ATPase n=1 Tax=Thiosulfativibrio zosterae TaxID=2675053 RepID=A0A6F8PK49_9GAMM|nr:heavy metal translocating P-type ATPase [Thiosulfativibrio zosterae]BBP42481.1 copper-translocating P-type ATPase [Thiosulfativibrio zosterae]
MQISCFHCGQAIPEGDLILRPIQNQQREFCCHGCAGVCEAIYEAGLESFYQRTPDGELLEPPPPPNKDVEFYDYDEVQSQFVGDLSQRREITLMSEAIHCAACIWLIEHSLAKIDGILLAKVNFTNKQIKVRWDNSVLPLSKIIQELNRIGYDATPYDPSASDAAFKKANRDLLYRLGYAAFAMMNVMWFSVALYAGADEDKEFRHYFHWLEFFIATSVIIYSAKPFFQGAWSSIKSRSVGMDVSISLGVLTTYFYSFWVTIDINHPGNVYFDTMIDFIFLLLIGRYLEAISKNKAIDATRRLMDLQSKIARFLSSDGEEQIVPVRKLMKGQIVLVKPGEKFPVDGKVIKGEGSVNESMLTGESREVFKQVGSSVSAGTINIDSAFQVEVVAILQDTTLGKIVHMVEDAQGSKAPIQCTAEKIMPWFVSVVLALATLSFVYWIFAADLETAMIAATSVLIITCPCAFGLATPMATAVAAGVSAQNGILIKNGAVLEVLNDITHFVFDKTGTLTKGQMQLKGKIIVEGNEEAEVLKVVASIESQSEHALAKALTQDILTDYKHFKQNLYEVDAFLAHAGKGVSGSIQGVAYQIGTAAWLTEQQVALPQHLLEQAEAAAELGQTSVWVVQNNQVIAVLFLVDEIRADARLLIDRLKAQNKKVIILSGDRQKVAEKVAEQLGGMQVIAEVLPQDKNQVIRDLQSQGHKVAMIGDGINDAPALVRADVGIALGSGTDVSADSADIVLLNDELLAVDTAVGLSARTLKTIKENIASSIIYNALFVPLAMAALLTPLIAAISMPLSSLVVIGNAARIRTYFNPKAVAKRNQLLKQKMQQGEH